MTSAQRLRGRFFWSKKPKAATSAHRLRALTSTIAAGVSTKEMERAKWLTASEPKVLTAQLKHGNALPQETHSNLWAHHHVEGATLRIMSWLTRIPTHLPLPDPVPWEKAQRIVVVLHGTASSPGIFRRLAQDMRHDQVRVEGVPYAAAGTGDLRRGVEEVAEKVNEIIAKAQGRRVDVVGHSLGGLMALRLLHYRPHIRQRIHTLIGLGACWRGVPTMRARWAEWLVRIIGGKAFSQIKQPLPFSPQLPEGVKVLSVVSDSDTVVPADSAALGTVVPISGVSHRKLPEETRLIRRLLDLPEKKPD